MVTRSLIYTVFMLLFSLTVKGQESGQYIHKNLTRATATFATGYMPKSGISNIYLVGDLEYYTDHKISIRGEGFYFFNSFSNNSLLRENHGIFAGPMYHFATKTGFDPFAGIQTGLNLTQTQDYFGPFMSLQLSSRLMFNPTVSVLTGFNYYAGKHFHLFINGRYLYGTHVSSNTTPLSLGEFRVSFGLGFNAF